MTTAARHVPDPPDTTGAVQARTRSRWPLLVIGAAAGTATWSGWVGLGQLTGFGVVHPLPGIWDAATLNTAITLPVGVEAYAIYALAVATDTRHLTTQARRFGWISAFVALGLGMAGQVAFHLLAADGAEHAPGAIVAAVSCLPVLVLGAASLLWHLAAQQPSALAPATSPDAVASVPVHEARTPGGEQIRPAPPTATASGAAAPPDPRVPLGLITDQAALCSAPLARRGATDPTANPAATGSPGSLSDAAILAHLDGAVPSMRSLMRTYSIGQARATRIRNQAIQTIENHQQNSQELLSRNPTEEPPNRIPQENTQNGNQETAPQAQQQSDTGITDRVGQSRSHPFLIQNGRDPALGPIREA